MNVETRGLTIRYGRTVAVDRLDLNLAAGRIYGLLGRNGAGKSSLLSVLAAFRRPSDGQVLVNGEDPYENRAIMRDTCFIRHAVDAQEADRVSNVFDMARRLRPHWDDAYAARLADRFALTTRAKTAALSTGQRSALGIVVGLASRCPLTIFDESYLGLDAPSRYAFYEELLADYGDHPRTVIVSTHLIEEVAALFEEVVIIDGGRLLLHRETDSVRAMGVSVTGPSAAVDGLVAAAIAGGARALATQTLGPTRSVTLLGALPDDLRSTARASGLELGPVGLQDLFVHLTAEQNRTPLEVAA